MEDFPSLLPESKSGDNPDKKKKPKKGSNLRVPLVGVEKSLQNKHPEKPTSFDEVLAKLMLDAKEKSAAKEKPKKKAQTKAKAPESTVAGTTPAESKAADKAEKEQDEPKLASAEYEPPANVLYMGEGILPLDGEEALEDRIIPLHAELGAEHGTPKNDEESEKNEQPLASAESLEPVGRTEDGTLSGSPEFRSAGEEPGGPSQPEFAAIASAPEQEVSYPQPEVIPTETLRQADLFPFAPASEKPATKDQVREALYYAEKSGQNRGVVAGAIAGGAYEHFKHKRREKRQGTRFAEHEKQLEDTAESQQFAFQRQERQLNETGRQYNQLEKRFENSFQGEKLAAKSAEVTQVETPEHLEIPSDHRLETSAWHSIEIDAKTGRPVENPTFQYGHEYYHERAQEQNPAQQRNAAAGEVALVAAAHPGQAPSDLILPPTAAQIPLATHSGAPLASDQTKPSSSSSAPSSTNTGPLWPWLVALFVILLCLVALIG